jgi:hypothetical protein
MRQLLPILVASGLAAFSACQASEVQPTQAGGAPESIAPAPAPRVEVVPTGAPRHAAQGVAELTGQPYLLDASSAVEIPQEDLVDHEDFLVNAFPPMLPTSEVHKDGWLRDDCIMCHETGVSGAPLIRHRGLPELLRQAKCRSCHVAPDPDAGELTDLLGNAVEEFEVDAFPPTLPSDESHSNAWMRQDCLLCHKWGVGLAPKVRHNGMSELLLQAKCRTCHLPSERTR